MAGDDLLEGVQEEILPLGVLVDLREDEGEVALEVSSAHTPYMEVTQNEKLYCTASVGILSLKYTAK